MSKIIYKAKPLDTKEDSEKKKEQDKKNKTIYKSASIRQHEKQLKQHPELIFYDKPITVALPWYIKYFFYLIWIFIVVVIFIMINSYIQFKPQINWWKNNGGNTYKKVFSINLLAQYTNFNLGYELLSLFAPKDALFNSLGQKEFILNIICSYAKFYDVDDEETYFLKPKNICETICVGTLKENTYSFNAWIDTHPDFKFMTNDDSWPATESSWRALLSEWGVPITRGDPYGDAWTKDKNNFLFQKYQLPADTVFIQSFMYNLAEDPDSHLPWYPQGFAQAVGLNPQTGQNIDYSGGWWGFVKYGFGTEKDLSYGEIVRTVYANNILSSSRKKCNHLSNIGMGLMSGAMSSLGIFAMPEAGLLGLGAAVIGSTMTIIQGYQSCGAIPS